MIDILSSITQTFKAWQGLSRVRWWRNVTKNLHTSLYFLQTQASQRDFYLRGQIVRCLETKLMALNYKTATVALHLLRISKAMVRSRETQCWESKLASAVIDSQLPSQRFPTATSLWAWLVSSQKAPAILWMVANSDTKWVRVKTCHWMKVWTWWPTRFRGSAFKTILLSNSVVDAHARLISTRDSYHQSSMWSS